jgi:hypothetical protein
LRETTLVEVNSITPEKLGKLIPGGAQEEWLRQRRQQHGRCRRQPVPGGALAKLVRTWDVTNIYPRGTTSSIKFKAASGQRSALGLYLVSAAFSIRMEMDCYLNAFIISMRSDAKSPFPYTLGFLIGIHIFLLQPIAAFLGVSSSVGEGRDRRTCCGPGEYCVGKEMRVS